MTGQGRRSVGEPGTVIGDGQAPALTKVRVLQLARQVTHDHLARDGRCPICMVPMCQPFLLATLVTRLSDDQQPH